jgi:hypothetical protein
MAVKGDYMYFEKPGRENTQKTLEIARDEAIRRGIRHIVVASTFGDTGMAAAEMLAGSGLHLVVVTHSTGFREIGKQTFSPEAKKQIEALGGTVYTGTMALHGLGNALRDKGGYSPGQVVADSLRIMGQGTKVAIEITAMCADAGLIPCEDVIAVAGSGRGADTAAVIKANSSNRFFDIRLREYLAKPRDF